MADPKLTGLYERMFPREDQGFPARDRQRLLGPLAMTLDAIYGEPDDGELEFVGAILNVSPGDAAKVMDPTGKKGTRSDRDDRQVGPRGDYGD